MRRVAAEATFDEEVVGTVEPLELKISSQNPVWKICTQSTEVKESSLLPRQSQFFSPSQTKRPRQSGNETLVDFLLLEILCYLFVSENDNTSRHHRVSQECSDGHEVHQDIKIEDSGHETKCYTRQKGRIDWGFELGVNS